ncbi:MAG: hypothetical protein A2Y76_08390 [Planctomycetes bacterium RBG_13_60_9]|nr:MAG: hypothetical protein A2Y76_08390 [Planctomycetes bacterium RBG_13_60_9]
MAKEVIGTVPVFVTSTGIDGPAKDYLQIHKDAVLEGIDGLSRNHYAWVAAVMMSEGIELCRFQQAIPCPRSKISRSPRRMPEGCGLEISMPHPEPSRTRLVATLLPR